MTLKNTVGTLAQGAVNTAFSAVRHPLSTASMAVGVVKGTAEASVGLVRGVVGGPGEVEDRVDDQGQDHVEGKVEPEVVQAAVTEAAPVPREPQVVPKPVPEIDELPEPIVIEADDAPGEAIHTEPKAASRDSEHGGSPGDREEAEGYIEEMPSAISEEPVVWTSESSTAPEPGDLSRPI